MYHLGVLQYNGREIALAPDNILLRGSTLKKAQRVVATAIFAGLLPGLWEAAMSRKGPASGPLELPVYILCSRDHMPFADIEGAHNGKWNEVPQRKMGVYMR